MGASEAPEKEEETRDSEAEADLATGTEHVAPGEEAPVEEANPEDGVHEVCIASQTSANIMKQAQDDDGRQADDELGRIAATDHEAADEEAAPCSEFDSADAGVADITAPAEATGGQAARSNAQETAAVRLVRTPAQRADTACLKKPCCPRPACSRRRSHLELSATAVHVWNLWNVGAARSEWSPEPAELAERRGLCPSLRPQGARGVLFFSAVLTKEIGLRPGHGKTLRRR